MTGTGKHTVGMGVVGSRNLGTLSLTLLLVVLCAMALGLLITSMAISTLTLSETRAETVREAYRLESFAQSLVARLDGACASGMPPEDALGAAVGDARLGDDLSERVGVTGSCEGELIRLRLECGRHYLSVAVKPSPQGMETTEWVMGATPSEEPALGPLFAGT